MIIRRRIAALAFSALSIVTLTTSAAHAQFKIMIRPNATLASNTAALAAFNRAADQWAARITDPITIYIDAGLDDLGEDIIGGAVPEYGYAEFDSVRDAMLADSADDTVMSFLPTSATFTAALPPGISLLTDPDTGQKYILSCRANFKALNFAGLDNDDSDGTISFSTAFDFDFDNSDGVTDDFIDFETVAAHEIGHLLGFFSAVDDIDYALDEGISGGIAPTPLDLFRFQNDTADDPTSFDEFAQFERFLLTGGDAITDDIANEYRMSTGMETGDGNQASHWKEGFDNPIGIMNPTIDYKQVTRVGEADFRAMDLIGYNVVAAPEPSAVALLLPVLTGLAVVRSRRRLREAGA